MLSVINLNIKKKPAPYDLYQHLNRVNLFPRGNVQYIYLYTSVLLSDKFNAAFLLQNNFYEFTTHAQNSKGYFAVIKNGFKRLV